MHTISMLRRILGLSSDNQVRNRMERIKDLLAEHIRRGPNNQIFLTEPGLEMMKQFQELYDTGLTLAEASTVLRTTAYKIGISSDPVSSSLSSNEMKQPQTMPDPTSHLLEEMTRIRSQLASLQEHLPSPMNQPSEPADPQPWWTYLREDIDVT